MFGCNTETLKYVMLRGWNMMELYSSHTTSLFTVHNQKQQYNNRLWIQLQSCNYSSDSPSLDHKKNNLPPKKTHLGGGFKNLLFSSLPSIWGNYSIWTLYTVLFFSIFGAFRRSWLPKPMPGSARASYAAVRATRPGSWMPCSDTSKGTAPVFEGIMKWDPKLGGVDQT